MVARDKTFLQNMGSRCRRFWRSCNTLGKICVILLFILILLLIAYICYMYYKSAHEQHPCTFPPCNGFDHIFCVSPKYWCADYDTSEEVSFTALMKDIAVHEINKRRNLYAGNKLHKKYYCVPISSCSSDIKLPSDRPPCARCGMLSWNSELEKMARRAVKLCDNDDSRCYASKNFPSPGTIRITSDSRTPEFWIKEVFKAWGTPKSRFDVSDEFFIVTHERQTAFGCAMVVTVRSGTTTKKLVMVCIFSYGDKDFSFEGPNISLRGGVLCSTGVDVQYKYLCSKDEKIEPNNQSHISVLHLRDRDKPNRLNYNETLTYVDLPN